LREAEGGQRSNDQVSSIGGLHSQQIIQTGNLSPYSSTNRPSGSTNTENFTTSRVFI